MDRLLFLAAATLLAPVLAQSTATAGTLSAATNVPADSASSGVEYFSYETAQLTDDVVASLAAYNASYGEFFGFGNYTSAAQLQDRSSRQCKYMPGDAEWPSDADWTLLDQLVGGTLIKGVPAAAVCYSDWAEYDEDKCAEVTENWSDGMWLTQQPADIDYPVFEGVSCVPPSVARPNATCTLGGMPAYVVNVTNVAQVQLAVNFARNRNLRLNVKSSGHDFNAKSTGGGSLSVWTRYLNEIEYLGDSYQGSSNYSGPAFKVGVGAMTGDLYEAAGELGLDVVGGLIYSIAIAGGYVAGGGNSPLLSKYGMGADQVVSLEVVLPDGRFVSVDENNYPDLFFAMRGGGGSTWGIVTSVVLRAYPKLTITKQTYTFGTGIDVETFWAGFDIFLAQFPTWPGAGVYSYFSVTCTNSTSCVLEMTAGFGLGLNQTQYEEAVQPFVDGLEELGIPLDDLVYTEYDGMNAAWRATWLGEDPTGYWTTHTASRLFPASNWEDSDKLAKQTAAMRGTAMAGGAFFGYNIQPAVNPAVNQANAVIPAWRNTLLFLMLGGSWSQNATVDDIVAANKELVEALQPWREASPDSGTYLSEADINEPNLIETFYGEYYDQLYSLKQQYDPWGVLYATTAVGAEDWYITGQVEYYPTQNGRLCPVE